MYIFSTHSSRNNGLPIQSPAKRFEMSGWLSKQMFSGIGYGIHVPVWATPSLFNTSCNSQENDTMAARTPPQLSDLTVVLSRPTAYYIFLKLRRKWCMKCMPSVYVELKQACKKPKQRGSSSFPVTPQSSKIKLLASWLFTWPYNLQTVGCSGIPFSTLSFQSFIEPSMQPPSIYIHLLWNIVFLNCRIDTVLIRILTASAVSSNTWSEMFALSWQPKPEAWCCLNTTKSLREEVGVDGWACSVFDSDTRDWGVHPVSYQQTTLVNFLQWPQSFPNPYSSSMNCLNLNLNHR